MGNFLNLILAKSPDRMFDLSVLSPLRTAKLAHAFISWKFAQKGEMVSTCSDRLDMRKQDWEKLLLNINANE